MNTNEPRSIADLAREALAVQDACNLSGVAFGFARAVHDLCAHAAAGRHDTAWKNSHPIAILWASKLASLTSCEEALTFARAWDTCQAWAAERDLNG